MGNPYQSQDPLLTEIEAAAKLGIKPETLQNWRSTKRYPLAYLKIGRSVRYRNSDLDRFLASRTVE